MKIGTASSSCPWQLRPAQPEDTDGIVDLLNQVFGVWGTRADWLWKYQLPPAPFRSPSAVAELDGRIIGHFGIVPVEAVWHGQTIRAGQTVDAAVLPAYRGAGIHSSLGRFVLDEAARAGLTFIYAFPGLFSLAVDERIGYAPVAFLPEATCVLHAWRALRLVLAYLPGDLGALWTSTRYKSWPAVTIHRLARLRRSLLVLACWLTGPVILRSSPPVPDELEIIQIDAFDTRFDRLWAELRPLTDLGVCKGAAYLTWRYCQRPSQDYLIFAAESTGEMQGFLVLRQVGLRAEILEWLALPEHPGVASALLATAVKYAKGSGSLTLSMWSNPGNPYNSLLRGAGFVSLEHINQLAIHWPFIARNLYRVIIYARHLMAAEQAELAVLAGRWPVSQGDSDLA